MGDLMRTVALSVLLLVALAGCVAESVEPLPVVALTLPHVAAPTPREALIPQDAWEQAASWEGEFSVVGDAVVGGTFPLRLFVMADDENLYARVVVERLGENPYYASIENQTGLGPERLYVMLAPPGPFARPADVVFVENFRSYGSAWEQGFWNGTAWKRQLDASFCPSAGPYLECRTATTSADGDTLTWVVVVGRQSSYVDCDGFQAPGIEPFGLRILLERQGDPATNEMFSDHFPRSDDPPGDVARMEDWLWLRFARPSQREPPPVEDCREASY